MTDWRLRARCRDYPGDLFFPLGTTGPAQLQAEEAKAVCRRCPVMAECLRWALQTGQEYGIWGGLTEEERRIMRRRAARAGTQLASAEPRRVEGPAYAVARTKGARITEAVAAGRTHADIARGLNLPVALVRQAHKLLTSGAVQPTPEPQPAGATR